MRRPFPLVVIALLAAAGVFTAWSAGGSSSTKLSAVLTAKAERPLPRGAVGAVGRFTATLTGSTLTWKLTFAKLTGKATAAHIHLGRTGVAGPVAVPLCGPCASGAHGTWKLNAKTKAALLRSGAYVNVHTARNAAGEIRGQISGGGTPPVQTTTDPPTTTSDDDGGGGGYGGY
jgi:hypothetical protein